MSFAELLEQEGIDDDDMEKINLLQVFYQGGYLQGMYDKSPNYEYSIKFKYVIERLLKLFTRASNPIGLQHLEKCLDVMDEYDKDHPSLF